MKLDLDDIERKARGREGCPDLDPMWPTPQGPRGPILCVLYPDCKCGHEDRRVAGAASTPPVVLALIARIRALEAAGREVADAPNEHMQQQRIGILRAVLRHGTVQR